MTEGRIMDVDSLLDHLERDILVRSRRIEDLRREVDDLRRAIATLRRGALREGAPA